MDQGCANSFRRSVRTLLLVFCVAGYLTWRLASPIPVDVCRPGPECDAPVAAVAPPAGLRVVLYDPGKETPAADATAAPYLAGWTSAEGDAVSSAAEAPAARGPAVFEVVGLGRPGAAGACAVWRGRELRCIALFDPEDETTAPVLP